jgi:GntR family transcriptional regulator
MRKDSLHQQVYHFLAQQILDGAWKPGAILPNAQELARNLGVSEETIRKAFDMLEADQIVVHRHGRGTFIVDHSEKQLATRIH